MLEASTVVVSLAFLKECRGVDDLLVILPDSAQKLIKDLDTALNLSAGSSNDILGQLEQLTKSAIWRFLQQVRKQTPSTNLRLTSGETFARIEYRIWAAIQQVQSQNFTTLNGAQQHPSSGDPARRPSGPGRRRAGTDIRQGVNYEYKTRSDRAQTVAYIRDSTPRCMS